MEFNDVIKQFSERILSLKDTITTEESTKMSLVVPLFQLLGYDVFNPNEFCPEYIADVGIKKGEKVDYAILENGQPNILVECKSCSEQLDKHSSQLFRYFGTSPAKFGILTNGIIYRFYTDLEESNKMDLVPFLEIDMTNLKDSSINELKKFCKDNFDKDKIFSTALTKWHKTTIDHAMLEALGIKEMEKKQYIQLSTGQKRRLHLALSLINDPDVIFLDEPTAGLDVEGRLSLHKQIRKLSAHGKTIVLASHDMAEVETLCDRIAILNDGNIVFCGTASELSDRVGRKYVIHIKTQQGNNMVETDNIEDALISVLDELKQKRLHVLDIKVDRGTLEQHFIEMSRRKRG